MRFVVNETMWKQITRYLGVYFYEDQFGIQESAILSTTKLLAYLQNALEQKRAAFKEGRKDDYWGKLRFTYFSAHDTTVAALLSSLEQK